MPDHPPPTAESTEPVVTFDTVEEALRAVAEGRPVVVTDDAGRENEGDLVLAATKATTEAINMMIRHARGLICVPMTGPWLQRLGIARMVAENREGQGTDFSVSVDAADGITTGISAYDRWRTVAVLADAASRPDDLVRPGHVFPLRARPGGVLERAGHTEAAVDLATLAGLPPVGVICEILNDDGSCARLPELAEFRERFGTPLVSIADLIAYRFARERLVERVERRPFPCAWGAFELHVFRTVVDDRHHLAFSLGEPGPEPTLVRVHSENLLADVFRARVRPGHTPLAAAFRAVQRAGRGVVLWLERPAGARGVLDGLERLDAEGFVGGPPVRMDARDYGIGAQILAALGLRRIRLLTHNPRHVVNLGAFGLEIVETLTVAGGEAGGPADSLENDDT